MGQPRRSTPLPSPLSSITHRFFLILPTFLYLFRFLFLLPLFLFLFLEQVQGQDSAAQLRFLETPDSLHKGRFYTALISGSLIYSGLMIGLNEAWYADFPRSK